MNAIWVYVDSLTFDVILKSLWESLNNRVFGKKIATCLHSIKELKVALFKNLFMLIF